MTSDVYEFTEVVRGRTEIRFSSFFRRGTEYAVEHVMGYSMYPSPYAPLYSHLRYDVFRDGEFIGQEGDYLAALRLVAVDFAYRLWRGPLGVILRDEDRLEELVWWFVREIPEKRENVSIVTNAYRPTETPERKPEPPKMESSAEKPSKPVTGGDIEDELVKKIAGLYKAGITEDEADRLIRKLSALSAIRTMQNDVSTASVVTHKIIR